MGNVNCLRCRFRHEDNGNCTAVGGFCTAVAAAHCPLLQEYLDTDLTPEEIDMDHEAAEQLRQLCQGCDLDRLEKLAEADKDGRLFLLPLEPGRSMLCQEHFERPWVMKSVTPCGSRSIFVRPRKKVEPLTPDEMRDMPCEPVYIVVGCASWWDIVSYAGMEYLCLKVEGSLPFRDYGKNWTAYRQKPEEV